MHWCSELKVKVSIERMLVIPIPSYFNYFFNISKKIKKRDWYSKSYIIFLDQTVAYFPKTFIQNIDSVIMMESPRNYCKSKKQISLSVKKYLNLIIILWFKNVSKLFICHAKIDEMHFGEMRYLQRQSGKVLSPLKRKKNVIIAVNRFTNLFL